MVSYRLIILGLLPIFTYISYELGVVDKLMQLCTGPGSKSRIFAIIILALNWKSLPLAWTVRSPHPHG